MLLGKSKIINEMIPIHDSFECHPAGLIVHTDYPHLGASPDGLIACSCCGDGLLEIKCPFKHREQHPDQVVDSSFCLHKIESTTMLKRSHNYFIQIQGQMVICQKEYCDFVCWTRQGIHIERISYDPEVFLS